MDQTSGVGAKAGKPQVFDAEENEVLRTKLRLLRTERGWTQEEVGKMLGIAQQNAGKLLGFDPKPGMSRPAANALARALGFSTAEELLLDNWTGARTDDLKPESFWVDRDVALKIGKRLGYSEEAMAAVVARHSADPYRGKNIRFWIDRFSREQLERDAEKR